MHFADSRRITLIQKWEASETILQKMDIPSCICTWIFIFQKSWKVQKKKCSGSTCEEDQINLLILWLEINTICLIQRRKRRSRVVCFDVPSFLLLVVWTKGEKKQSRSTTFYYYTKSSTLLCSARLLLISNCRLNRTLIIAVLPMGIATWKIIFTFISSFFFRLSHFHQHKNKLLYLTFWSFHF